jgi:hypothetical protein
MSEYDVVLTYSDSDDVIALVVADTMVDAAMRALDDAIYFNDAKYIASMEIIPNDDKINICR